MSTLVKILNQNYGLIKAVYGKLGATAIWNWNHITSNPLDFKRWLDANHTTIKSKGSFGNHRKYETLKTGGRRGTYQTFESFFNLVNFDFQAFINSIPTEIKNDKKIFFNFLFKKFSEISGFGRLAVFDFLCMIGKVGILNIEPDSPYLENQGPIEGTKLLFDSNEKKRELNEFLKNIGDSAFNDYPFIMQILEDCACNWQKSPTRYNLFRG